MVRYYRKVIKIRAEDSPNVRYGLAQRRLGLEPTGEVILEGVLDWNEYLQRRALWDKIRQCIGLDAEFYEGEENLLFPPEWLNLAEARAEQLRGAKREAQAIGIDPAEGGDKTSWSVVDYYGLIKQISKKTPNTAVIVGETIALMQEFNVPPEKVGIDRGGGGKQHADNLREKGYPIRTIAFGESPSLDPRRGLNTIETRIDIKEDKYTYLNRRAEMYHETSLLFNPSNNDFVFALPPEYAELRRQLAPMPLLYDAEGRIRMLPKNKRNAKDTTLTLTDLLGCSPDEADSLVVAVHVMKHRSTAYTIGSMV